MKTAKDHRPFVTPSRSRPSRPEESRAVKPPDGNGPNRESPMKPTKHLYLLLSVACLAVACGPSSSDDAGPSETDSGPSEIDAGEVVVDAGTTDAGHDAGTVEATTIAFSAPAASVEYVTGTVRLQLVTTGPDPERVELWKDGALFIVLPPPYTYDWLTDEESEDPHVIEARAMIDGAVVATAERTFHVDRTPPMLIAATPMAESEPALSAPIVLTFSEPLQSATIGDASVTVTVEETPLGHTRTLSADATAIELRLTEAPEELPATTVVTATTAITDLAGNALEADALHSIVYPAWITLVAAADLPVSYRAIEMEIDATGVVWILGRDTVSGPFHLLWSWDGVALGAAVPVHAAAAAIYPVLRLSSTGRPVVAYADSDDDIHVDTLQTDGSWSYAPVFVADSSSVFDMELGPDDVPYIARRADATSAEVLQLVGGTWTRVGNVLPTTANTLDLAVDSTAVYLGYADDDDAVFARYTSSWDLRPACTVTDFNSCTVRVVAHGPDTVRGLVSRSTRTSSGTTSATLHVHVPPTWTVPDIVRGGRFGPAAGTPTGHVRVVYITGLTWLEDDALNRWTLPSGSIVDVDAHAGRPYFLVGSQGLRAFNSL